jgi:choline dehydrogenase-like flavoprotein
MAVFDESWTHADVVVVGGGTSGAAVAGLLAEGSSARVLVLEAGPDYGARDSGRWPGDLLDARAMPITHAWGYDSGPLYPERVIPFDRARVIGGCSSHNRGALGQPQRLRRLGRRGLVRERAVADLPRGLAAHARATG